MLGSPQNGNLPNYQLTTGQRPKSSCVGEKNKSPAHFLCMGVTIYVPFTARRSKNCNQRHKNWDASVEHPKISVTKNRTYIHLAIGCGFNYLFLGPLPNGVYGTPFSVYHFITNRTSDRKCFVNILIVRMIPCLFQEKYCVFNSIYKKLVIRS